MQSGSSEHMAAMRYGWDGQKIELLTVGGCTNDVNVVDFIKKSCRRSRAVFKGSHTHAHTYQCGECRDV